jgi:hydroxymethylpyrimidine/phosphomethylpyrimidine kinase
MVRNPKFVLTIAGSDSSAGAGIQSDLKTFHNYKVYGLTVITAITAQNTKGVQKAFALPAKIIDAQLKSIFSDFKPDTVKTGMLGSADAVKVIYKNLKGKNIKIVVDPVMLSKNRFHMLGKEGIELLKNKLLPITFMVTPNLYETEILAGFKINNGSDLNLAAKKIFSYGCEYVLLKGGHFHSKLGIETGNDILYDGKVFKSIRSEYVKSKNTHGIGCTLSAAIAANLAKGKKIENAIIDAKLYIIRSLKKSVKIGKGVSPIEQ